ncbi:DNA cytosine methyltransferase [Candidatus Poribacteria bacterium]|nr:DNA cytosine methyltransferase [Candidatus Poribacteria bacterium]
MLQLRGKVTMIVGGPPCQGFSLAGKRNKKDARNSLFKAYIRIVEAVQPLFILLENVHGITVEFDKKAHKKKKVGRPPIPYSQRIARALDEAGYEVQAGLLRAAEYGVPQFRPRYFLLAARRGVSPSLKLNDPFKALTTLREDFLLSKGLSTDRPTSVKEAISDLETVHGTISCVDSPKFMQGTYAPPTTHYQRLMKNNLEESLPDSHRLANHRTETVARFTEILATCRRGVQLSHNDRERFGLKKHCTVPLDPDQPSHTLTTLPDDIIHYSEARILTVREYARLQSIPDWFQFRGAYTTGGDRRVRECPRYTQVGNAVPPFLGEVIGAFFTGMHNQFLASSILAQRPSSERIQLDHVAVGAI